MRKDRREVPTGNQNYITAQFIFTPDWDGLSKTAIFYKKDTGTYNVYIEDGVCTVPNELMETPGTLKVSVFAGNRRTVNAASIEIIQSGYREGLPPLPPESGSVHVQSPDSSVPYIGYDGAFWFEAEGEKRRAGSGVVDTSILERISALESALAGLQAEATAKWVMLNTVDNRSRNNTADIAALRERVANLEARP